jgi:hypothetical protein
MIRLASPRASFSRSSYRAKSCSASAFARSAFSRSPWILARRASAIWLTRGIAHLPMKKNRMKKAMAPTTSSSQ